MFRFRREYDKKRQALVNQRTAFDARYNVMQNKLFDKVISDDEFSEKRKEVVAELKRIDGKLSDLERSREVKIDEAQAILLFTRDIYRSYQKASPTLKRHMLGFFWSRFEVSDGVIITSTPSLLFAELLKLKQAIFRKSEIKKHKKPNESKKVILRDLWLRELDSNQRPIA